MANLKSIIKKLIKEESNQNFDVDKLDAGKIAKKFKINPLFARSLVVGLRYANAQQESDNYDAVNKYFKQNIINFYMDAIKNKPKTIALHAKKRNIPIEDFKSAIIKLSKVELKDLI